MSEEAFKHVIATSTLKDTAYTVLLMLADHADDDGVAYPGWSRLAERARCSERSVATALDKAEKAGEITRIGRSEHDTVVWQLNGMAKPNPEGGVQNLQGGDAKSAPKAVVAHRGVGSQLGLLQGEEEPPSHMPREAQAPKAQVDGATITDAEWEMATGILDRFRELAQRPLPALNSRGKPTDNVKKIIIQVREHPEIETLGEHLEILEAAFKRPWWGRERPSSTAVVYGPKTFPRCISERGRPGGKARFAQERSREGKGAMEW